MNIPGGLIDTDEVRATVRRLTDALYDYLTLDITAAERAVKQGQMQMIGYPMPPPDFAEQLAKVVEDRDAMQDRIENTRATIEDAPEIMRGSLELTVLRPLEDHLKAIEEHISFLQKRVEESRG